MITTAMQPASQAVEIQGAPSASPNPGDEFRLTFVESVSDSSAQDAKNTPAEVKFDVAVRIVGGPLSGKQGHAAELLANGLSADVTGVTQSFARSIQGSSKVALDTSGAVSSSKFNVADAELFVVASTPVGADDQPSVTTLPIQKLPVPAVDAAAAKALPREKEFGSQAKSLAVPVAAIEHPASAGTSSSLEIAKQGSNALVHCSRKEDASVADKEPATGQTRGIDHNSMLLSSETASVGLVTNTLASPYTQPSESPGELTSYTTTGNSKDTTPKTTALDGLAWVQPNLPESSSVSQIQTSPENMPVTDSVSTAALNAADMAIEKTAKAGAGEDRKITSLRSASLSGASTMESVKAISTPNLPAVPNSLESVVKLRSDGAGSGIAPVESDGAIKTGTAFGRPDASAVSQARSITLEHPVLLTRPQAKFSLEMPNAAGVVPGSGSDPGAESSIRSRAVEASEQSPTTPIPSPGMGGEGVPTSVLPFGTQGDPALSSQSAIRPVSASAGLRDTKAKPQADDAPQIATEKQPAITQHLFSGPSYVSATNPSADLNGLSVGSTTVIGVAALQAHATTPEVAAPSSHPVGAVASTVAAHPPGEVAGNAFSESNAVTSQVGESHRTLLATPTALEVGVQSGTQGWLRIRAEVGGQGEINTSLAAASSGARELLHSQLPALNAFLHSEQIAATATVVGRVSSMPNGLQGGAATGSGGLGSQDGSGGSNGSLLQDGGAQSDQGQRDAPQPLRVSEVVSSYDAHSGISDTALVSSGRTMTSEESGRWLNVRV